MVRVGDEDGKVTLRQNRFLDTNDVRPEEDSQVFPIPISVRTKDHRKHNFAFVDRTATLPINTSEFVKININHTGFFRTAYPISHLRRLGGAVSKGLLSSEDQVGIVADTTALVESGVQSTLALLTVLESMHRTYKVEAWRQMEDALRRLSAVWRFDPRTSEAFQKFAIAFIEDKAAECSREAAQSNDASLVQFETLLNVAAGEFGDEE